MKVKDSRFDFQRLGRIGMVEAIWGEHKTSDQIVSILKSLKESNELALVTRIQKEKANEISSLLKDVHFHPNAHCLTLGDPLKLKPSLGEVLVISGGTSDLVVASEADLALRWHGIKSECLIDIGVAGLHRLLGKLERIKKAKVIIACAGMEGALPTVLAGLVPQPIIGIPVSVGYGVSQGGRSALNGMLASCAPGLVVVNIDNGYGAAMAALRILKSI